MSFYTPYAFYLFLVIPIFFIFKDKNNLFKLSADMYKKIVLNRYSSKKRALFLALSFICMVIALARPIYFEGKKESSSLDVDMIVALDISKSMMVEDIYPNRFSFAKNKLALLIDMLNGERVGVLAFSNQAFIISPLTNNYKVLNFLVDNLKLENINQNGTNLLKLLDASDKLIKKEKKPLVIFTDGSENKSFEKEIEFAKQKNISVYIYNIATKKGGVINEKGELQKDKDGNIVISKLNEEVKKLAFKTGGIYKVYSLKKDDLAQFIEDIKSRFNIDENMQKEFSQKKELFFIPLFLAFIFLVFSRTSLEFRR